MDTRPVLALAKDLQQSIRAGHPWIYDRALAPSQRRLDPGALVRVAHRGQIVAVGFVDPASPIRVRVLGRDGDAELDAAWAARRAEEAASCRLRDPTLADQDGLRLIHGENDAMPGLVIDRYCDTGVLVFDGPAAAAFWRARLDGVWAGLQAAGAALSRLWVRSVVRAAAGSDEAAGRCLRGDPPPERILIDEHGARFEVDVRAGQKTGFFLDQRRNRTLVRELSAGAEVLNLCCYTGGFSVHAALGGARRVTSVDLARPAIEAARRNFAHSGLDPKDHAFAAEDAFEHLARAAQRGARFDLVVVDPPSFAPSERARPRALRAYTRLNRMALEVVEAGGWLVSASCSSHVRAADLLAILAAAGAEAGRRLRVLEIRGADRDHPVLPGFPEGQYLDLCLARVQ
ncbi:class I SAM-dependent rRNA methyltransferase [Haliangium sp.]|uniref:class I SAM-dependent rRNA methyltransferase n=1 Tax=Haliangium sp. TaxID=2663208 RepID=UPI003D0B1020